MKKKLLAVILSAAMAVSLAACGGASKLGVTSDDTGIHAVATNGAEGSGTGQIAIEEGYGLCVNHVVEQGSFHVKATDNTGAVILDKDLTDNIADLVPANGEIDVVISAQSASGTVDVIPYDVEAQAQADASLDDALAQDGLTREDIGVPSS